MPARRHHRPARHASRHPVTPRGRSAGAIARLALLVVLSAALALPAAACSAQPEVGAAPSSGDAVAPSGATGAEDVGARAGSGSDWSHVLQVVANVKAAPPAKPLVILLGGSAARESTISDRSWRTQIVAKGGPVAAVYNLGSSNRTLAQNVAIVKALPEGTSERPTIVYIGVNLGSFTRAQKTARISLPQPDTPLPAYKYKQHHYSQKRILTAANKRMLVKAWLTDRYPVFKRNFASSAGVLDELIATCKTRGLHPVLFELPRNTAIIGRRLDAPTKRYRDTCRALAGKHGIPYVNLVAQARLRNHAFYDLWHLIEPGRKVWQSLLSTRTATLLKKYGETDAGGT